MSLPHQAAPQTNGAGDPLSDEGLGRLEAAIDTHIAGGGASPPDGEGRPFGRFLLRRVLGQGRFGIVFLADDPQALRHVALKLPQAGVMNDPDLAGRFLRDVEAAAHLDHPGIVAILETGVIASVPYIVMPYVPGPTLAGWLDRQAGPAPVADAVGLLISLADALQHAHERGVLHCDLKPANVLLSFDGMGEGNDAEKGRHAPLSRAAPRVVDFGLARLLCRPAEETRTHIVAGSPPYMAPEQAAGTRRDLTALCDVHALAAILYELLTGRQPYHAESEAERVRQLLDLDTSPAPPRSLRRGLPRDLEAIVLKGLEKDPDRRYVSAKALADDLRRFRDGRPTKVRPVGLLGRVARWARRRPAAAALAAGCVGMAVLAVYLVGLLSLQHLRHRQEIDLAGREAKLQEFYATFERVRTRRLEQPHGWADENLSDLRRLAVMGPAADHLPALRSEAGTALAAPRLRLVREVGVGKNGYVCAFSPDGEVLALGERYPVAPHRELRVWLVRTTGVEVGQLSYPVDRNWEVRHGDNRADGARSLAYSPDGRWLVLGTRGGRLVRWDLRDPDPRPLAWHVHTGDGRGLPANEVRTFDGPDHAADEVRSLRFNRDGSNLLSGSYGNYVCHWNVRDGWRRVGRFPARLPVGSNRCEETTWFYRPKAPTALQRFDLRTGRFGRAVTAPPITIFSQSPCGERLTALTSAPGVQRWLIHPSESISQLSLLNSAAIPYAQVADMAFLPCGRWVCFSSEHLAKLDLWDALSGTRVASAGLDRDGSARMAVHPHQELVAVCGKDRTLLFQVDSGPIRRDLAHSSQVFSINLSANGENLATSQTTRNLLDDETSLRPFTQYSRAELGFTWLRHQLVPMRKANSYRMALGQDGTRFILCVDCEDAVGVAALDGRRVVTGKINDLQLGPEGRVWVATQKGDLLIWDGEGPTKEIASFSPDQARAGAAFTVLCAGADRVVAGRRDGKVEWFDGRGLRRGLADVFADQEVSCLAVAADSLEALVGGSNGAVARLALSSGEVTRPDKPPHTDTVVGLAYLGGRGTLTASADQTIRLWDQQGRALLALREAGPIAQAEVSSAGELFVLVRGEWGVRVWDLAELSDRLRDLGLEPGFSVTRPPRSRPTPPRGLIAELFGYPKSGYVLLERRHDPRIAFDWGQEAPSRWMHPDDFQVRWTGRVRAPRPGDWEFQLECGDATATAWIDGRLVLRQSEQRPAASSTKGTFTMPARPVSFRLDYQKHSGHAHCRLLWRPAGSKETFVPVPPEAFTPD